MFGYKLFVVVLGFAYIIEAAKYEVDFDKCEIAEYNKTIINNWEMKFKKINNTFFYVTSSADLLVPINLDEIKASAQVYNFDNGEYKINPKLKITLNTCNEYKLETLAAWKEIEKHGNLKGCGKLEPGKITVTDWAPRVKMFDVQIPTGKYRINVRLNWNEVFLFELDFYSHIVSV